jgi:hypothetical protein
MASAAVFQMGAGGKTAVLAGPAEASGLAAESAPADAVAVAMAATRIVRPSARLIPYPP